jgi:hypothetical protein
MPNQDERRLDYDSNHPMYRELHLLKEMFNDKLDTMEDSHKREIEGVYYKIEDMVKLICAGIEKLDEKLKAQEKLITFQIEQQADQVIRIETDVSKIKKEIRNASQDFFWKVFIRIVNTLTAAGVLGVLGYLVRSKNI